MDFEQLKKCHIHQAEWKIREGTLPWAIFRFRIFSNYFLQKFEKIKILFERMIT